MKFTLTLTLGNDAMQTYGQIRRSINRALDKYEWDDAIPNDGDKVYDRNGNTVGEWKVAEEETSHLDHHIDALAVAAQSMSSTQRAAFARWVAERIR